MDNKKIVLHNKAALAAITGCVLFWGFSFISTKIAVSVFPPVSLGMIRFAIALFFLFFIKLKLAPNEKLRKKDIPLLFLAGFTGVTMYFICENNGVSLVSASEASIAVSSIPALIMITELIAGKIAAKRNKNKIENKINIQRWIGCLVSIAGVWLTAGVSFAVSGNITGYIFMSAAAFSWVTYCFLTRPLFANCSRIYIVFWQTLAGFICFIPFSFTEFQSWGKPDLQIIIHVLFLGIFCSAMGYWFYVRALEVLGVSVCAVFINLIPVVTVIAGFFLLGDRLTVLQWLGAALVVFGVYLAMWEPGKKDSRHRTLQ